MKTWKRNWRWRFRVTDALPARVLCTVLAAGLTAGLVSACDKTTGGTAIHAGAPTTTSPTRQQVPDPAEPVPGVVRTLPDRIPPDALTCFPSPTGTGQATVAAVADPAAPRITISVPVTVAAAQFCGYSSQQLTGTFQGPSGTFDFADRVTHIWTNSDKYLASIHLEGPPGAPGFDAAKTALMQEFGVVIP